MPHWGLGSEGPGGRDDKGAVTPQAPEANYALGAVSICYDTGKSTCLYLAHSSPAGGSATGQTGWNGHGQEGVGAQKGGSAGNELLSPGQINSVLGHVWLEHAVSHRRTQGRDGSDIHTWGSEYRILGTVGQVLTALRSIGIAQPPHTCHLA